MEGICMDIRLLMIIWILIGSITRMHARCDHGYETSYQDALKKCEQADDCQGVELCQNGLYGPDVEDLFD